MGGQRQSMNGHQMEALIGNLLRAGVIAAASLVVLGGVIYLFRQGPVLPDYKAFQGEPAELRQVWGIMKYAFSFQERGLIQLGLLVLIATPIARVLLSIFLFWYQRDRMYVIITGVVLAVLFYSLFYGRI